MDNTYKKVSRILWIVLFFNFAVAAIKIIVGYTIHSVSMTADGFHSLTDGASNVIGIIGIKLASRPIDTDHPYGHGKFETLTGLFISVMLFLIGGKIILEAINQIISPALATITFESLIALVITLMVNIFVSVVEKRAGEKLGSQILISDAMHTKSDIYISIGVLTSLLLIKLGAPLIIDPIVSVVVSVFIFRGGYLIFRDNSRVLVDEVAIDIEKIKSIVLSFEDVKDAHNIRSRRNGHDYHIDLHILTKPEMSVEKSHMLIHEIEKKLREDIDKNIQVIAHIEPFDHHEP